MAHQIKPCSIPDCKRPLRAKGLCATHYARMMANGSPHTLIRVIDPIVVVGERHARLVAIEPVPGERLKWRFQCDCGNITIALSRNVRKGNTRSCGCYRAELPLPVYYKHGLSNSPTWRSWSAMWDRCTREKHPKYRLYGGRGITVCARWEKIEQFVEDMGLRPDGKTLDRIDGNGNYEPGNCRWATPLEQRHNRRA